MEIFQEMIYLEQRSELINNKHKKICRNSKYLGHSLFFYFLRYWMFSITTFAYLVGIPVGITKSAATIKICILTAVNKKYKSVVKKKEEKKMIK